MALFHFEALMVICCLLHSGVALASDNLVVSFMISSGNQRTFWETEVIKKFKDANPDITEIGRAHV